VRRGAFSNAKLFKTRFQYRLILLDGSHLIWEINGVPNKRRALSIYLADGLEG